MFGSITAGIVIWCVGGFAIYWNLEGKGVLPSNDHVRVLAVTWPLTFIAFCVWGLFKSVKFTSKTVIVDTAASFRRVAQWENHLLAPPKPPQDITDLQAWKEAQDEVNRIAPEA